MTDRSSPPESGSGSALPRREQVDVADLGGEPVCWLPRVCPECGRLSEREPPTTCAQCGTEIGID